MECPNCKLLNPPGATACDCGYDFKTCERREPYATSEKDQENRGPWKAASREVRAIWFWLLGVSALLLLPWFYLMALSTMTWDSGTPLTVRDDMSLICVWAYPMMVVIALIFRRKIPAPILLPPLDIAVLIFFYKLGW